MRMPKQENQAELLSSMHSDDDYLYHGLTSCQWLERRFVHAENRFVYSCNEPDDGDGCPKTSDPGIANKSCLTDPYDVIFGSDNNDQDELGEK